MRFFYSLTVTFACVTFLLAFPCGAVVYVDSQKPDGGSGRSWDDAFNKIQPAIDAAAATVDREVWVAAGVYEELRFDSPERETSTAVILREGVKVYGGFKGTEEGVEERDCRANETVIEGNSACHVIAGADDALLDGFTIRGGVASKFKPCMNVGGGMINIDASPHVRNCTFINNYADVGGAVYNSLCEPLFESCTFMLNSATRAGAVDNVAASPMFLNCLFIENTAGGWRDYGGSGGAVSNEPGAATFINCLFWKNGANGPVGFGSYGGAISNKGDSVIDIVNCTFYRNFALNEDHCSTVNRGGAVYNDPQSIVTALNSIFWADYPDEIYGGAVTLVYCHLPGPRSTDPIFMAPEAGDFRLQDGSPCIDAGSMNGAPGGDIRGVMRPRDDGIDIGAFEAAPPVPGIETDVCDGLAPLTVHFYNASDCSGFPVETCGWDFGDGAISSDINPVHTYEWPGVYTVCLTVMTCEGRRTKCFEEYIKAYSEYQAPSADFFADPLQGPRPLSVQFIDASVAGEQPILAWCWNFGDGATGTETNPIHVYTKSGKFTVSLTVTNESGSDTKTKVAYICVEGQQSSWLWKLIVWLLSLFFKG